MAVQHTISIHDHFVQMDMAGFYTPGNEAAEARKMWKELADTCRSNGKRRVLVRSSMTGELPAMVSYEIASHPEEFGWERAFRIAMVFEHKERYESHLFPETVMVNRYYDMKAFMDENEAKTWLLRP